MIEEKKLNLFLEIDSNSEIFEKICHSEDIVYVEGFFWKREYIPCPEDDCLHLHIDSERNITIYDTEGTIMWKSVENPAFETYACLMYIHTVHTDYTFYLDASGLGMLNNSAWESEITSPPVRLNSIDFNILYKNLHKKMHIENKNCI